MICARIFHSNGDFTIAGEEQQNLGLCSMLSACEQGAIFIMTQDKWMDGQTDTVNPEYHPKNLKNFI
jgi:hypothetical protein